MRSSSRLSLLPVALVLGSLAHGQTIHTRSGDPAPGGFLVELPLTARIDDEGQVLRLLRTSNLDSSRDVVLALEDDLLLNEGQQLLSSPEGFVQDFVELAWTPTGMAALYDLTLPPVTRQDALFWNGRELELQGSPVTARGAGAGSTVLALSRVAANADGVLFAIGEIADPTRPAARESVLLRYRLGAGDTLLSADVLAETGDSLPVLGAPVLAILAGDSALATNARGDVLCTVDTVAGGPASILLNLAFELAREGELAPLRDRRYLDLAVSRLALNDHRDYAFTARLDGDPLTSGIILENGAKFVQGGDVLPEFSTSPLHATSHIFHPVLLDDAGRVFWRASSDTLSEVAYMRDRSPIVGVGTVIDGETVTALPSPGVNFGVSPQGRFWVGRVVLGAATQALVTADFGLVTRFGGCRANDADLSHVGGLALPGDTLQLTMSRAQAAGVVPVLRLATRRLGPCGVMTGAGEALLDPTSVFAVLAGPAYTGAPSAFSIPLPSDASLVEQEFFAQGAFADVGDTSSAANLRLTNGLRIVIGAP